jgi:hypothetical protein
MTGTAACAFVVLATLVGGCAASTGSVAEATSLATRSLPVSIAPTATVQPTASATAIPAGTVVTIEVPGSAYVRLDESPDNKITPDGDVLVVETVRGSFMSTRIGWELPPGSVPPGTTFSRIDMKICGSGSGDFWETYAPSGGEPLEQEVTQPTADGCWHFDGAADGDPYFKSFVNGNSRMRIERIVYTLTVA